MANKKTSGSTTQVKIGITESNQELNFETDLSHDQVNELVSAALKAQGVVVLQDVKERTFIIPSAKLSYVELGASSDRKVGFTTL